MPPKKKVSEPVAIVASDALASRLLEVLKMEDEVATLEEQLKDRKAVLRNITENELAELAEPEMFEKNAVVVVGEGDDARGFMLDRAYYCGIKSEDKPAAHAWLEENGHGAMLKRTVSVSLPKDSREIALKIQNLLRQLAPHMEIRVVVDRGSERLPDLVSYVLAEVGLGEMKVEEETELAGATLTAFVTKQLEAGRTLPAFFNVYSPVRARAAEIPKPKEETPASPDAAS